MTDLERDLLAAIREEGICRKNVTDWMDAMGKKGELVLASQAPGWEAYQQAVAQREKLTLDYWNLDRGRR